MWRWPPTTGHNARISRRTHRPHRHKASCGSRKEPRGHTSLFIALWFFDTMATAVDVNEPEAAPVEKCVSLLPSACTRHEAAEGQSRHNSNHNNATSRGRRGIAEGTKSWARQSKARARVRATCMCVHLGAGEQQFSALTPDANWVYLEVSSEPRAPVLVTQLFSCAR